ncbi:MAG: cytochrome C biogenesis protein [Burkholderiales bacterium]|nr:cytochrome C biogenesis protein [Burkholderiales bacterium]
MSLILLHLITSLAYLALAAYLWRGLQHSADAPTKLTTRVGHALIAIPLLIHAVLLSRSMLREGILFLGIGNTISLVIGLAVLIYWVASFFHRLEALNLIVLPTAALLSWLPVVFPASHALENTELLVFKAHLLIAMLAYSLFTIASLHVLLMALMERQLHSHNVPAFIQALPPLLTMESVLFKIIGAGFIFLTMTLATGVLFSEELFGKPLPFTHKTLFGFASWFIFGALLLGRSMYGWRGRVALRWTLAGFVVLVLAYIGSRFVIEIILQR